MTPAADSISFDGLGRAELIALVRLARDKGALTGGAEECAWARWQAEKAYSDAALSHWRTLNTAAIAAARAASAFGRSKGFDAGDATFSGLFAAANVASHAAKHAYHCYTRAKARAEREQRRFETFRRIEAA